MEVEVVNGKKVIRVAASQTACAIYDEGGIEFSCAFNHLSGSEYVKICPKSRDIFITPEQLPEYLTWRLTK